MDYNIKDSGQRQDFETGAKRDIETGKGRYDLIPFELLRQQAIHCEKGAMKYGLRNWEKGIPLSRFLSSSMRHLSQAIDGQEDEDHIAAASWNLACYTATKERIKNGELPVTLDDVSPNWEERKHRRQS
ncbi:MAG: dATP/dGTP diphosphohydrolase domain-containing protein [Candidatus Doudnabacteria bacterium]|jgi:hypothetical protein